MKKIYYLAILLALHLGTLAQEKQGVVTDMINDKKSNFSYTTGTLHYDNNFLTRYIITEKNINPLKKILVNYDKNTGLIDIAMYRINQKDTIIDKYKITYHDSLGLIFTQRRTVTELLKGQYELVLIFKDSTKTFLEVLQIMNQSTVYKKHYLFRLLTSVDIATNVNYLKTHPPVATNPQIYKPLDKNSDIPTTIQPQKKDSSLISTTPSGKNTQQIASTPPQTIATNTSQKSKKDSVILHQPNPSTTVSPAPTSPIPDPTKPNNTLNTPTTNTVKNTKPPTENVKPIAPVTEVQYAQQVFNGKLDSIDCILIPASHEMIVIQVIVKGGVANYPFLMQGIEPLLLHVLVNGATKMYSTEEVEARKNALMIRTELIFEPDYSVMQFEFPKSSWNDAMKLIGELIGKPAFNLSDIEEAKGDVSVGALTSKGDIWMQQRTLAVQTIFQNQHYSKTPWGEGLNMAAINMDALKKYYASVINRNNIKIAVMGKVSPQELRSSLKTHFRWLNWGSSNSANGTADFNQSDLKYSKGEDEYAIATCVCPAPKPFSSDYEAFVLATYILEKRIRKANLNKKYIDELHITLSDNNEGLLFIQFAANDADKAMQLIIDEIKKMKKSPVTPQEWKDEMQKFVSEYYMKIDNNDEWYSLLAKSCFYANTNIIEDWMGQLQKTSSIDAQSAIIHYIKSFRSFYTGEPDTANPLIFTQRLE